MRWNNAVGITFGLIVGIRALRRDPCHYLDAILIFIGAALIYA
jgi:hypothetical protein